MKVVKGGNIVFVRRTGGLVCRALVCLLSGTLVSLAFFAVLSGTGAGASVSLAAGFLVACSLFAITFPENTLFDLDTRTVQIGGSRAIGPKTEVIPFADILDIRRVTKGDASGYCLRLRANPLFDCRLIGDVTLENAYSREFRLQALPKIKKALSEAGAHLPPQPDADLTCFERKPGGWTRKLPLFPRWPMLCLSLLCAIPAAWATRIFPFLREYEAAAACWLDRLGGAVRPERRHVVDPAARTLTILRGFFFLEPEVLCFDDAKTVFVRLRGGNRAAVYLRFRGKRGLCFLASGGPRQLREITARYAFAMNLELSGKIEYLA